MVLPSDHEKCGCSYEQMNDSWCFMTDERRPTVDGWVTAWTCYWLHEAHLMKSVLEGSDIEVAIPDEYFAGVQPMLANGIGGIRVLVHASDLERATEVLAALPPPADQRPPGTEP